MIDHDDWRVSPEVFEYVNELWGPHTIDRFANSTNTKLQRFNSKFLCPNTEHVDAFTTSWEGENNYLVPPVSAIPKVIAHLRSCRANGTLIAPHWPSALFYPLILENKANFKHFVKHWRVLGPSPNLVLQGENSSCFIGSSHFKSAILVLRIEF